MIYCLIYTKRAQAAKMTIGPQITPDKIQCIALKKYMEHRVVH